MNHNYLERLLEYIHFYSIIYLYKTRISSYTFTKQYILLQWMQSWYEILTSPIKLDIKEMSTKM